MQIPNKVKIGFFNFEIKEDSEMIDIGLTDADRLFISLNTTFPNQIIKETLLHECLHALLSDTFIVDYETEEKVVRVLSPKLIQLLKTNKELIKFLISD